ncbi:unnamed protein product [Arctogadus glacialis]
MNSSDKRGLLRPWTELLIRTGSSRRHLTMTVSHGSVGMISIVLAYRNPARLEDLQFGRRSTVERRHSCFQMAAARFVRKGKQLRPELSPPRFVGT